MSIDVPRTEYDPELSFSFLDCPIDLCRQWYQTAVAANILEPNAVSFATVDKDSLPSVRMLLLKDFDLNGFRFFTNLESEKSIHIQHNPNVALCFYWDKLHRQVRISGTASTLPREDVEEYFSSRPRGAQISASVSRQSKTLSKYSELEAKFVDFEKQIGDNLIPTPEYWGGYLVRPKKMEFWQGAKNRLHHRMLYTLNEKNKWDRSWLNP